jgi:hypothetical protein
MRTLFNSFAWGEVRVSGTDRAGFTSDTNTNTDKINLVNGDRGVQCSDQLRTGAQSRGKNADTSSRYVVNNGQIGVSGDFSEVSWRGDESNAS